MTPNMDIVEMTPAWAKTMAPKIAASDPWHRLRIDAASIEAALTTTKQDNLARAILLDDIPAGAIVVQQGWLLGPYLKHLSVAAEYRGAGLGQYAIDWLIHLAQQTNQQNVWLCVSQFNQAAQRFYVRNKFTEQTVLQDLVRAGENEILMRRRV